jgi:hypothetical protein
MRERFKRLEVWRHREYAHIAVSRVRTEAEPSLHDIGICFVVAAKIIRYMTSLLMPGREDVFATGIQRLLREQAKRFVDSVHPLPSQQNKWVVLYHRRPPSLAYNHVPPKVEQPYAPVGATRGYKNSFRHDVDPSQPTSFVPNGIAFKLRPDDYPAPFPFFPFSFGFLSPPKIT